MKIINGLIEKGENLFDQKPDSYLLILNSGRKDKHEVFYEKII